MLNVSSNHLMPGLHLVLCHSALLAHCQAQGSYWLIMWNPKITFQNTLSSQYHQFLLLLFSDHAISIYTWHYIYLLQRNSPAFTIIPPFPSAIPFPQPSLLFIRSFFLPIQFLRKLSLLATHHALIPFMLPFCKTEASELPVSGLAYLQHFCSFP